jgi:fructan beta-fructosidase
MMTRILLLSLILATSAAALSAAQPIYDEPWRPQFHFSPPQKWMNDPNGMVYLDGEYHLFYQYNPYATVWGPMHWGHAVTTDLVHWHNMPIALFPDAHGTIFSGSAVDDAGNTSGFGSPGQPPLVAIFTYDNHFDEYAGQPESQRQGLAYSVDRGRSWAKYAGNPVLADPDNRDFRDPKVFWYAAGSEWVMTLAVHDHVAFYSSKNLRDWRHESDFGEGSGAHGGVWECPDLIEMPVAGSGERKAVLLVSINPGGPNGGSATQYFVGSFDGHRFTPDPSASGNSNSAQWIDYGTDDYAGSTWSGSKPDDQRMLYLGWMSNWQYANQVPTERWRSAMTLPRELRLVATARGLELKSMPVAELTSLRTRQAKLAAQTFTDRVDVTAQAGVHSELLELELSLRTSGAKRVELVFSNAQGQNTTFRVDKVSRRYEVDRSGSGMVDFNPVFSRLQSAPLREPANDIAIHAYVDRSSIELFINGGETTFTVINFPASPYTQISLKSDGKTAIVGGSLYELKSIWDQQ